MCRQGIAGTLLQACEAVAASAGFWTFFIQADLKQQDRYSLPFLYVIGRGKGVQGKGGGLECPK